MKKLNFLIFLLLLSYSHCFSQAPDSVTSYVNETLDIMQKNSLYADRLDWTAIRDTVSKKVATAKNNKEVEGALVWAFSQLKDKHGFYAGADTFYRYTPVPAEPDRLSKGIKDEYQKPRSVKIKMLDNQIAYYKMPAVLIGSNTKKMKEWANILSDSLCKIAAQNPKAFILDLRMNNGGNSEPMHQTLKQLVGEKNRIYVADSNLKIIKEKKTVEKDSAEIAYQLAGIPDRVCQLNSKLPVAVLIGQGTASSGEIVALSFTTRPNTKLFGERTAGVANVTNGYQIQNKGYMLLSHLYVANAKKRVLSEEFIDPDVYVKSNDNYNEIEKDITVQAAIQWLSQKIK